MLVAVCDKKLLNKKLRDDNFDFHVNPKFYFEKEVTEEEAIELIKQATIVNLVGEKSVEIGVKAEIISPSAIIKVDGIPHAQMVKILQ